MGNSITVHIGNCDDRADVYLNGNLVMQAGLNQPQQKQLTLNPGPNALRMVVVNSGAWGWKASFRVEQDGNTLFAEASEGGSGLYNGIVYDKTIEVRGLGAGTRLVQRYLFIGQGPGALKDKLMGALKTHSADLRGYVSGATNGRVDIQCTLANYISTEVQAGEYQNYKDNGKIAGYSANLHNILTRQMGVHPEQFDGIFRAYHHDRNQHPSKFQGNTWMWFNEYIDPQHKKRPGFTSLLADSLLNSSPPGELMLHEYLHQMDHRFGEVGVQGFVNPDTYSKYKNTPPLGSPNLIGFYQNILKNIDNGSSFQPVPYPKLDGHAGRWV